MESCATILQKIEDNIGIKIEDGNEDSEIICHNAASYKLAHHFATVLLGEFFYILTLYFAALIVRI